MKFIAKAKLFAGKLLDAGMHLVTVSAIVEDKPSHASDMPWKDVTPQVKVTVKNAEGFISHWFNLKGYKNASDYPDGIAPKGHEFASSEFGEEQYLINSTTKQRVENLERTEKALEGLLDFAVQCGIPAGTAFELKDLEGKSLAVKVRAGDSSNEVHFFTNASRVKQTSEVTA
jgi:hypothetical protein